MVRLFQIDWRYQFCVTYLRWRKSLDCRIAEIIKTPATSLSVFTVYPRPDAHGETFLQAKLEALNIFPSLAPFRHKWVKMEIRTRFQKLLGCWHEISRLDAKPNKYLKAQEVASATRENVFIGGAKHQTLEIDTRGRVGWWLILHKKRLLCLTNVFYLGKPLL